MNLNEYLQTIRAQLTMQPKRADQITTEIEQHINDQTKQHLLNGVTVDQAELQACEEFGQPTKVAARFNKTYRHPLHSFWRVVGVVIAVSTLIRILLLICLQYSLDYQRIFGSILGPSGNDTFLVQMSCAGFALAGIFMARFLYHYLQPIRVGQTVQRLTFWLATIVTASYHLVFSIVKVIYGIVFDNDMYMAFQFFSGSRVLVYDQHGPFPPFPVVSMPSDYYYLLINVVYLAATTITLIVVMQLIFWWLQKHAAKESVIRKTVHSLFSNL